MTKDDSRRVTWRKLVDYFMSRELDFVDEVAEGIHRPDFYGPSVQNERQNLFASATDVKILHGLPEHFSESIMAKWFFRGVVAGLAHPPLQVA
jgi:hypothetical protein